MSIKDNAVSHYKDKLAGKLLSIDVPEWNGTIYYRDAINGKKQSAIMSLYAKEKMIEAMTMSLIVRALDKDGNPIWHPRELTTVMHEYDNTVVSNIVAEMTKDEPSIEDAKKL